MKNINKNHINWFHSRKNYLNFYTFSFKIDRVWNTDFSITHVPCCLTVVCVLSFKWHTFTYLSFAKMTLNCRLRPWNSVVTYWGQAVSEVLESVRTHVHIMFQSFGNKVVRQKYDIWWRHFASVKATIFHCKTNFRPLDSL